MTAARKLHRGRLEAATTTSFFNSVRRFCTRACIQEPTDNSEMKNSHAFDMMSGASLPGGEERGAVVSQQCDQPLMLLHTYHGHSVVCAHHALDAA